MQYTKEEAKEKIKNLVEKFKEAKEKGSFKGHSEEDIKIGYILELFEIFGWNTRDIEDLKSESKSIFRGRVDHAFKINGVIKFLLEDKKLSVNIKNNLEIQQKSYNYGYHKGIRYVIITNFEQMIVLDCFTKDFNKSIWKIFGCDDYYNGFGFDFLYRFRKSAFLKEKSELDQYVDFDRKTIIQRNSVEELIYAQLKHWRDVITKEIQNHPIKNKFIKTDEELDEAVQTLINRLIFIRFCEDKGFESYQRLKEIISKWELRKGKGISEMLREIFIEFDKDYDSELFTPPKYIDLELDDKILFEIINSLYTNKENNAFFDFADIGVDVLGDIYEEYLEYLLYNSKKKSRLKQKHQHRKQFGQFYTPSYIVKYILDNTLQKKLEKINERDINNIKILDPACGSGSFLIKAIDVLKEYYNKHKSENGLVILKNNIFAVDIDKKACEIAKLNLLLKTIPKKQRLDHLKENIKNGNSLISGDKEELKKYFNNGLSQKKPFNWEEEFNFKFDVIIENPPYLEAHKYYKEDELDFIKHSGNFKSAIGRLNTYSLFLEQSIKLLKEDGYLGTIIPNAILTNIDFCNIRKFILEHCIIEKILDFNYYVFEQATVKTIILILKKENDENKRLNNEVKIIKCLTKASTEGTGYGIQQEDFYKAKNYMFNINITNHLSNIINKIYEDTIPLSKVIRMERGFQDPTKKFLYKKQKRGFYPYIKGKDIVRYGVKFNDRYVDYQKDKFYRKGFVEAFQMKEKLFLKHVSQRIVASYDGKGYYGDQSTRIAIVTDNRFNIKYILAILNSKLINFIFRNTFIDLNVKKGYLDLIPIKIIENQKQMTDIVDKIIELKEQILLIGDKYSTQYLRLKERIEELEKKLNDLIYQSYNVSKEEIEIIEKSIEAKNDL